ncbi:hypothetical protein COJ87_19940 [Bacillus cereus]|uniref:DUF4145 domain-containing protein n=1 Tax=Bacillus cereus TaxID=1396 RepID=UPI000BECFA40|nr:DUF4145 domain-containing protein [Bacillus cereus]PEC89411.1 hypothetical protein CON02_20235 [Bacillus cereus]PFO03464.1 hypothetical protein COJ68_01595 [Bacillus cereus]PFO75293.1 hypothetical protein COJ87_19940 [Bacillus cereus]PGN75028.1 hypothetical protein CN963_28285 [Bacillus cereus]
MTALNEKVLACHHCGNKTAMKEVAKYKHNETEDIWDYAIDLYKPVHGITYTKEWRLFLCPVCINVTLENAISNSEETEPNGRQIVSEELLYPFKTMEINYIPKNVAGAFEAALKVRLIDGAICAIAIRRTLEMMCKDKGEEGQNLYSMLKALSDKGVLPPILNDMASVLRVIGNAAAHADEAKFSHDLVPSMIEFTNIILDYVYNLPKQIETIQDRIGKKTTEVRKSTDTTLLNNKRH